MIISGGANVYPLEVETELLRHAAIKDAAVVGVADEKWGEVPIAFLVLEPGTQVGADSLTAFLAERLRKIKIPRKFVVVQDFPRNAYGKVLKNDLRDKFQHVAAPNVD